MTINVIIINLYLTCKLIKFVKSKYHFYFFAHHVCSFYPNGGCMICHQNVQISFNKFPSLLLPNSFIVTSCIECLLSFTVSFNQFTSQIY